MKRHASTPLCSIALVVLLSIGTAHAEVVDSSAAGFTVRSTVRIARTPEEVYRRLVKDVGKWWNPTHTYSGKAANLSIDDKAGGGFTEKIPGHGSVLHMTVVYAEHGKILRLHGGLGPLQALAASGSMTWVLSKAEKGTTAELTYTVGGYRAGGFQSLAPIVDLVLSEQLTRLRHFCEKGKPE